nr:MAG TPA: hypothetical protein [Caudoviricetes sp.]
MQYTTSTKHQRHITIISNLHSFVYRQYTKCIFLPE